MSPKATAAKITESKSSAQPTRSGKAEAQAQIAPGGQVLDLQRAYGNRAVQRMYAAGVVQARLKIGKADDKYEREADRVADQVMRMPERQVRAKPS